MQYKRSIDNSLNCSTKADSHRKYVCYSGRCQNQCAKDLARALPPGPFTLPVASGEVENRRRGVSPKTWCIAEDVAYRRRRGVSPKTWRIAEDVAYRRRRGVSPKTWRIAEDVHPETMAQRSRTTMREVEEKSVDKGWSSQKFCTLVKS
ncbi:hypothetical protein PRIPAC_83200 [Pristionchus pacificus]|uniref:Uncharacterized protein n=1 Tax=Pristionchus pacificus TaxID=54126 RepID=A0A2A6BUW3_PRIPA|nr:hypothetical protein PRIPAC_83200 [Pristionchus pacificus]|eukprot:PDM69647.1 hypothetical protein PRIPAC_44743 [Pristionchus pacificus]